MVPGSLSTSGPEEAPQLVAGPKIAVVGCVGGLSFLHKGLHLT